MTARPSTRAITLGVLASLSLAACGGVPRQATAPETAGSDRAGQTAPSSPSESSRGAVPSVTTMRGMTGDDVTRLLGTPQFRRHEVPVELWQYRGDGCVLHLFLYRDGGGLRVQYGEVRSRVSAAEGTAERVAGASADECLVKLAAARPAPAR